MKQIQIFLISLHTIICCTGCAVFSQYLECRVKLPALPSHWLNRFGEVSFCLEYLDMQGTMKTEILPPGETSSTIRFPGITNWPITAVPKGDIFTFPRAGALYPWDLDKNGQTLILTWENGFAAQLLMDCIEQGFDVARFNGQRFTEEVQKRSGGDPWKLDYPFIAGKILSGDFRATYIKMLPQANLCLLTNQGNWFFSSPFSPVYEIEQDEEFFFEDIPLGFHRLFNRDSMERYEMYVTEQDVSIIYFNGT